MWRPPVDVLSAVDTRFCLQVLRNKNKQLKQLTAELNMFETDTKLQKHDINKMEKEVTDLKKKYYKEKKHRQENLDKKIFGFRRAVLPRPQFTGGGFKLSVWPMFVFWVPPFGSQGHLMVSAFCFVLSADTIQDVTRVSSEKPRLRHLHLRNNGSVTKDEIMQIRYYAFVNG